jgi:hypothetical protein
MEFSWRVDVDQRYSPGGKTSQAGPPVASPGRFQEHLPLAVAFTVSGYDLSPLLALGGHTPMAATEVRLTAHLQTGTACVEAVYS